MIGLGVSLAASVALAASGSTVGSTTSTTHNMKRRRPSATSVRRQSTGLASYDSPENNLTVPTCGQSASLEVSDTPTASVVTR